MKALHYLECGHVRIIRVTSILFGRGHMFCVVNAQLHTNAEPGFTFLFQVNLADTSAGKETRIQEVEAKLTHCEATCNRITEV
jgi:hypothetical protein